MSTVHAVGSDCDALLYVNSANGPFGFLTKLAHKRTAINVDGMEWARPKWRGFGARYFWWSSWLATKLFDVIITDSTGMADIYRREFRTDSHVIEYGADIVGESADEHVPELGLTKGGYYLIVGRMIPDNNVLLLVEGFVASASKRKLVVLGDVPYRDAYADRVKSVRDPRIMFPGYIRDKRVLLDLYTNCYSYLHGHEFGGTNPSLLKALGTGCCIAALDTVFSREVLKDDEHGYYFTKDPSSIRDCIQMLDDNPTQVERLRRTARSRIHERYTWERIVDEYERLLRKLQQS
jgi:glycosyltransferase involved in cell wall biosynthesis